jgi:hypothetical protein
MHGHYATQSELWTWAAVREDALSVTGHAWRDATVPRRTRPLRLDNFTQTTDGGLTCLCMLCLVQLLGSSLGCLETL